MALLWLVHRDPQRRAALARLAAATEESVLGAPGDTIFERASPARVIVMGIDGDWEAELAFASAVRERSRDPVWILCGPPGSEARALQLFDAVAAEFLAYPPEPGALRRRIAAAAAPPPPPALSRRASREAVAKRFARWFPDLQLPELLRALDPGLADVPLLVQGEPGTGRSVLARYVHWFGGTGTGSLVHVPCATDTTAEEVRLALARSGAEERAPLTSWLEDVEQLPARTWRAIESWIEAGAVPGVRAPLVRWIGTTGEEGLVPELAAGARRMLGQLAVRLPPLRERPQQIEPVVAAVARSWCAARHERPRRFGEDAIAVLEEYPWPGNLRELESVVIQTLAAGSSDPVRADDLREAGRPFAPLLPAGRSEAVVHMEPTLATAAPDEGSEVRDRLRETADRQGRGEAGIGDRADDREPDRAPAGDARTEPEATPVRRVGGPAGEAPLRRLSAALSHEVRNPLATIRTFASLLPERFQDVEFRERFVEMVTQEVERIDALVERLSQLAVFDPPAAEKVDISALLEELLTEREETIRARRLLVLKELETRRPSALGDEAQLRFALDALLGKSFDLVPARGDLYIASRHHTSGVAGDSVRVLVRFHGSEGPEGGPASRPTLAEHSLEIAIAELVVRAQGGNLAIATNEGGETVILVDLPAPG